jgi:hypothetical protein
LVAVSALRDAGELAMRVATDQEVWHAAAAMIKAFAEHAPLYALQSVDQLIERGDFSGAAQWRRVWRATEELLQTTATAPNGLH